MSNSKEAVVTELPQCDFCADTAQYDAKTGFGPWANMCETHFQKHGLGALGMGFGQRLVLAK